VSKAPAAIITSQGAGFAGVIVVEAELVDGLACPFFIRNPDEISRPGECAKRGESGGKR
jgi:hypothetical protein